MRTSTESLEFLDNKLKTPLIEPIPEKDNKIEKNDVVETILGFMEELFTTIFMKDYYENIKKNK
jgi:hypothetical protein